MESEGEEEQPHNPITAELKSWKRTYRMWGLGVTADDLYATLQQQLGEFEAITTEERIVENIVDFIFSSNSFEGVGEDIGNTRRILSEPIHAYLAHGSESPTIHDADYECSDEDHKTKYLCVKQHFECMVYISFCGVADIGCDWICALHKDLMKGLENADKDAPVKPGAFREEGCYTIGTNSNAYQYSDAKDIRNQMEHLCQELKDVLTASVPKGVNEDMFKCAGHFMIHFLKIHPFGDGNGRLCRVVVNWILKLHGFPLHVNMLHSKGAKREYIQCLEGCQWKGKSETLAFSTILERCIEALEGSSPT